MSNVVKQQNFVPTKLNDCTTFHTKGTLSVHDMCHRITKAVQEMEVLGESAG